MISLPVGMIMGENLYPSGRLVPVWVGTTHTSGYCLFTYQVL
jgi:hypothetical protein